MNKGRLEDLSKRERQIMDAVFKLKRASVAEVLNALSDPPSYNSVRVTLTILEKRVMLPMSRMAHVIFILPPLNPAKFV